MFEIIKKIIYFGEQKVKKFNKIQFLLEFGIFFSLVIFSIMRINDNMADSSCGFLTKLVIAFCGGAVAFHLAYYQSTHVTWKYQFPQNRPSAVAQVLIYSIFYLGFLAIICKLF